MLKCMAGVVAALALVAGAAAAEPGGGKGHGGVGGRGQAGEAGAAKERHAQPPGRGGGGGGKGQADRPDKPRGSEERGGGGDRKREHARSADSARGEGRGGRPDTGRDHPRRAEQGHGRDRLKQEQIGRSAARPHLERAGPGGLREARAALGERSVGLVAGCPPGLAARENGCTPPGQLHARTGWQSALGSPGWWGLAGLPESALAYVDGYLVRLDDGRIDGWLPLLGGALAHGNPWPDAFPSEDIPAYYQDYYGLGPSYRSYDDVLYRLDPETSAISSVAALLTGDRFAVGEAMPSGYDVYNVPYDYRDRYADGQDAWYRYSDGYVYQFDPKTRLVTAMIELLA